MIQVRRFNVFIDEERAFDIVIPVDQIEEFLQDEESGIIETALEALTKRLKHEDDLVVIHDRDQIVDNLEDNLTESTYDALVLSPRA
jgi:hypothetical protein